MTNSQRNMYISIDLGNINSPLSFKSNFLQMISMPSALSHELCHITEKKKSTWYNLVHKRERVKALSKTFYRICINFT